MADRQIDDDCETVIIDELSDVDVEFDDDNDDGDFDYIPVKRKRKEDVRLVERKVGAKPSYTPFGTSTPNTTRKSITFNTLLKATRPGASRKRSTDSLEDFEVKRNVPAKQVARKSTAKTAVNVSSAETAAGVDVSCLPGDSNLAVNSSKAGHSNSAVNSKAEHSNSAVDSSLPRHSSLVVDKTTVVASTPVAPKSNQTSTPVSKEICAHCNRSFANKDEIVKHLLEQLPQAKKKDPVKKPVDTQTKLVHDRQSVSVQNISKEGETVKTLANINIDPVKLVTEKDSGVIKYASGAKPKTVTLVKETNCERVNLLSETKAESVKLVTKSDVPVKLIKDRRAEVIKMFKEINERKRFSKNEGSSKNVPLISKRNAESISLEIDTAPIKINKNTINFETVKLNSNNFETKKMDRVGSFETTKLGQDKKSETQKNFENVNFGNEKFENINTEPSKVVKGKNTETTKLVKETNIETPKDKDKISKPDKINKNQNTVKLVRKNSHDKQRNGASKINNDNIIDPPKTIDNINETQAGQSKEVPKTVETDKEDKTDKLIQKTLFKCNDCKTCYVSVHLAATHACTDEKWECTLCLRIFAQKDKYSHLKQHKHRANVKTYPIFENLIDRVLFQCPQCNICFKNANFENHFKVCGKLTIAKCDVCQNMVHDRSLTDHRRHRKYILIQYVKVSTDDGNRSWVTVRGLHRPGKLLVYYCSHCNNCTHRVNEIHLKKLCLSTSFIVHDICLKCGLSFSIKSMPTHNKHHDKTDVKLKDIDVFSIIDRKKIRPVMPSYHQCGRCKINYESKLTLQSHICHKNYVDCEYCCELFNEVLFPSHVAFHELQRSSDVFSNDTDSQISNNTRDDDDKVTIYKCVDCDLIVTKQSISLKHVCIDEKNTRYCDICEQKYAKYQKHAHKKMHVNHPDLTPDKLVIKSFRSQKVLPTKNEAEESIKIDNAKVENDIEANKKPINVPNIKISDIIYKCGKCKIVTDNYDTVVEHSQSYLKISNNNLKATQCDQCELQVDDSYWPKHKHWHKTMQINAEDFNVCVYDPDSLLLDSWYRMFGKFSVHRIKNIVEESIYKDLRSMQLRLIKNGKANHTIYVCNICNTVVDKDYIQLHLLDKCKTGKCHCTVCDIPFNDDSSLSAHKNLHSNGVTKDQFRIIAFLKVDEVKRRRKHKVFRCRECSGSVIGEKNVVLHKCIPDRDKRVCPLCNQLFSYRVLGKHRNVHNTFRDFTEDRISIEYFQPKNCKGNPAEGGEDSDADIPNVSARTVEIPRTSARLAETVQARPADAVTANANSANATVEAKETLDEISRPKVKPKKFMVYKCKVCSVVVFRRSTSRKHKCVEEKYKRFCEICQQKYVCQQSFSHKSIHAENPHLTFGNFEIVMFKPLEKLDSGKSKSVYYEDVKQSLIYKCNCGLHILSKNTLVRHLEACGIQLEISAEKCLKCALPFLADELPVHMRKHHTAENTKISIEEVKPKDRFSKLVFAAQIQPHANTSVTKENNIEIPRQETKPIIKQNVSNEIVILYKCEECDVYFLTKAACYKHVKNHVNFNPIDYLECKLCHLQFTIKALSIHLKRHHVGVFDLDNLVVEQYKPMQGLELQTPIKTTIRFNKSL